MQKIKEKYTFTLLVEHWYNMFFARKSAKTLSGKTDTFFSTTTFYKENGGQISISFCL